MSEDSVLVQLCKGRTQTKLPWADCGNKAAVAVLGTLFLFGVCGIAAVLRFILQNSEDEVAARYLARSEKATEPSPLAAPDHHLVHPVHLPPVSAEKLHAATRKHKRGSGKSKAVNRAREFSENDAKAAEKIGATADSVSTEMDSVLERNATTGLDEHGLVFVTDDEEDYYADLAAAFNGSQDYAEETARNRSAGMLRRGSSSDFSSSSPTVLQGTSSTAETARNRSAGMLRRGSSLDFLSSSPTMLQSTSSTAAHRATLPTIATATTTASTGLSETSTTAAASASSRHVKEAETLGPALAAGGEPFGRSANRVPVSPWVLFCFYDDRSNTRSPSFSVYDFPVQLCTDVAFCCVDVSSGGRLVVSKYLRLFLRVVRHEFLPQRRLYLALGGHRALLHHLDALLHNPAHLATRLSDEVLNLGAGGLAVYLEDLELLKHGFRVHDLIMALRRVRVAVVLPRDVRQQVRYYRTEVYANTRDMLVITPPSQGYGAESRPPFATCPHPRRSVHEGASLEFIYQLSRTLLSPSADGADYVSDAGGGSRIPRLLMGVSLGGLKFQLKNRSRHEFGSPATFIRGVPYREICKQPWHQWHDNVSECFVAWNGDRAWMSSLGPHSTGFATEMVRGLAVFDVDFDDYRGECGNKFPVLRALRSAVLAQN